MILIDLPMPEACDVCPFNYDFCWCNAFGDHDEWEKYSNNWNDNVCDRETRPEYCPLKEIVRCKDCKNFRPENYVAPCKKVMRSEDADENWFCADGERR